MAMARLSRADGKSVLASAGAALSSLDSVRTLAIGPETDVDVPEHLQGLGRKSSFETAVVARFAEVMALNTSLVSGLVWERPYKVPGAKKRWIDTSLFINEGRLEVRIELGQYSKRKVKADATKLQLLAQYEVDHHIGAADPSPLLRVGRVKRVASYLVLWRPRAERQSWDGALANIDWSPGGWALEQGGVIDADNDPSGSWDLVLIRLRPPR